MFLLTTKFYFFPKLSSFSCIYPGSFISPVQQFLCLWYIQQLNNYFQIFVLHCFSLETTNDERLCFKCLSAKQTYWHYDWAWLSAISRRPVPLIANTAFQKQVDVLVIMQSISRQLSHAHSFTTNQSYHCDLSRQHRHYTTTIIIIIFWYTLAMSSLSWTQRFLSFPAWENWKKYVFGGRNI